jgi:hypothetical protein
MNKLKFAGILIILLFIAGLFLYFKYFFTYEQKNIAKRKLETITGQNLTVSVIGFDGKVIKRWGNVQRITSGEIDKSYTYFYTKENKYVQIPDSVWYIAEEE